MNNQSKVHYIWPDLFKTVGILMVILQHTWESVIVYPLHGVKLSLVFGALSTFSRTGVPLFIVITGYFALKKKFQSEYSFAEYWHRKISKFYLSSILWIIILWLIQGNYQKHTSDLLTIFFIGPFNGLFTPFWYVAVAIMLWLFLPFIAIAKHKLLYVNKYLLITMLILPFIYYTLDTTDNQFHWLTTNPINSSYTIPMAFISYFSIACLGYMFINYANMHHISNSILLTISGSLLVLGIGFNLLFAINHFEFHPNAMLVDWYSNIWNLLFSCGVTGLLFLFASTKICHYFASLLYWLAKYSMAVFFCHYYFVNLIKSIVFSIFPRHLIIVLPLIWISTIICSYLFVWIISKIPYLGKVLVKD